MNKLNIKTNTASGAMTSLKFSGSSFSLNALITPLEMRWKPKEDITTYELAKCFSYLLRVNCIMPHEIDKTENYFRHFEIIDHNR